ncbi:MAG TPA: MFS transporter [Kiloniellales bacterium]|jgi:MFS family permease
MTKAIAPVSALLLSVAILLMGNGLQGTLLPVRAQIESFSAFDIGILGSAYFLGFAAGCLLGPFMVRRVGHIRAFTAMVSIASTTVLAHVVLLDPYAWWPLRAVTGFCFAVLYMIIESWLNERATNENRGLVFSVYTIINLTVLTIGQMMMVLGKPSDFLLFALSSILVSLAAVPVAMSKSQEPAPLITVRVRIKYLYRISPVGAAGSFVVGLTNGSFWSLAPFYAQLSGTTTTGIALFMSTAVIAGAAGQWPLGHLSDKWDRRKVIVITSVGAAAAGLGLGLVVRSWSMETFALSMLFGAFALPLYALCAAHMNDFVEPGGFVEASSGLLLLYAGGAVVGPIIASVAMRGMGPGGLFVFTAVAHAAMAMFAIYRMTSRAAPPESARGKFADALRMASAVSVVDTMAGSPGHEHPAGASAPASQNGQPAGEAVTAPGPETRGGTAHGENINEDDRQTDGDHPKPEDR